MQFDIRRVLILAVTATVACSEGASASTSRVASAIVTEQAAFRSFLHNLRFADGRDVSPAQARAAVPKVRALVRECDHAAMIVGRVVAATPSERQAQAVWVSGMRQLAVGYTQTEAALHDIALGEVAAAWKASTVASNTIKAGLARLVRADKLLHLQRGQ